MVHLRHLLLALPLVLAMAAPAAAKPKIHVSFHWHMHQPIYWPYESVVQSQDAGRWSFDLMQIHNDRSGPYSAWPMDAVQQGLALPHLGAQVSFTGSLIENLDAISAAGRGFGGWKDRWSQSRSLTTSLGNPRLDLTMIGQHHPLMPLVPGADRRLQLELHKNAMLASFGPPAKAPQGIFPPETAFAEHVIPDFAAAGVKWALVDNIHFDRARPDYPYSAGSNLYPPNAADQRNSGGSANWVQLQNLWAPTKVSAPWGYQPHWVEYVEPDSGQASRIIAVPAARYEGNEDARGGYGAFLYESVMSQYEAFNTDDAHPMLVVLHHDGDNYGGGTDSYYHSNFANFVSWISSQPDRFEATTIQDYLDRFPPDAADVIHVEPGSWSGADNGDPEFLKWNGDPAADGYSPDRNSWGVIVAAANRVHTAQAIAGYTSLDAIRSGTGSETDQAWHHLLNGETSCYWYWDNAEGGKWDSHPARAANLAVQHADAVLAGAADTVAPTVYLPQREPYNPGAIEWGTQAKPSDFDVWTYAYDVSGLASVTLRYRVTPKGTVDRTGQTYAATGWQDLAMLAKSIPSRTDPVPTYKADEYRATIAGVKDALVDYYVAATDSKGQVARSPIQHVYVGAGTGTPSGKVGWSPSQPTRSDAVTLWAPKPGKLHWGVDGWKLPPQSLQPAGTVSFDAKSVETPLAGPDAEGRYTTVLGPFTGTAVSTINFVIHYDDGTWNNNGGGDYLVTLVDGPPTPDGGAPVPPGADSGSIAPSSDAGSIGPAGDAGAVRPATDAGVQPRPESDGGASVDPGPAPQGQGCGCSSASQAAPGWFTWMLALAIVFAGRSRSAALRLQRSSGPPALQRSRQL
ncbi:MAG TPA: MYXO-CTERM sorting domain-containing protein [Myxococcales bacterium]|jgi:MYXO-CTERM domain-containing protein